MNKTNLLNCPKCWEQGKRQILAEVLPSGFVAIQRLRHDNHNENYKKDYTIVNGKDFSIICAACGEIVFTRYTENVRLQGSVTHLQFGTP